MKKKEVSCTLSFLQELGFGLTRDDVSEVVGDFFKATGKDCFKNEIQDQLMVRIHVKVALTQQKKPLASVLC